jgi:DNA-binding NarL/FixJ family response regulator
MPLNSPCKPDATGSGEPVASPTSKRPALRVLLVDDHLLVRCRTRQQLEDIPDLQVVGEAVDGFEAVALTRTLSPDLVLMDVSMPGLDGIEATRRIMAEFPRVRVMMLSSFTGESSQSSALVAGAHGYLVKGESTQSLAAAIQRVCFGL